jgi:hypothetical protein
MSGTCLNCDLVLEPNRRFCGHCGQKTNQHRLTISHILHEVVHFFTHADIGILHLYREMALRPGQVIQEYIEGRRKRYFNPLSFFMICISVSTFISHWLGSHGFGDLGLDKNQQQMTQAASQYNNWLMGLSAPVSSIFSTWLFRKKGYNFAEHLVFQLFVGGFALLPFLLVFVPLSLLKVGSAGLTLYMLVAIGVNSWAYIDFFKPPKWKAAVKSLMIFLLVQILVGTGLVVASGGFKKLNQPPASPPAQVPAAAKVPAANVPGAKVPAATAPR